MDKINRILSSESYVLYRSMRRKTLPLEEMHVCPHYDTWIVSMLELIHLQSHISGQSFIFNVDLLPISM